MQNQEGQAYGFFCLFNIAALGIYHKMEDDVFRSPEELPHHRYPTSS